MQLYLLKRLTLVFLFTVIAYGNGIAGMQNIPSDTTKVPNALKISRDGILPQTPVQRQFLLSELDKDTVKQVFQAPPCLDGQYYLAFQLFYDLGDRQTQQLWQADLEVSLVYNTDTLWTKPLGLKMADQLFIATVFHDTLVTCDDNLKFHVRNKSILNGAPQDYIYLNILLYKYQDDIFDPAATFQFNYSLSGNETSASWSYNGTGQYSYDLEWVFIDSLESFSGTAEEAFTFKEPVRINTAASYYNHLTYYPSGKLYYRIRAIGVNPQYSGHYIPGHWSYGAGTPLNISNHQYNITWQRQTVFSETGKYKKVITYYDGTSRHRQVQTNLSSNDVTLVGENFYDYEGRMSAAALPVPVDSKDLQFRTGFNDFTGTDPVVNGHISSTLKKFHYDNKRLENSTISNTGGAGLYYSANNSIDQLNKDFIPDASGYVYSQTEYIPDGTGRITRQAGVGQAFKMDGDHAVRYYYGEAASAELIRLFGSNVGNALHYKKNVVVDGNGQVSVNYLDQEDRTIATALAGTPPTNLDSLKSFRDLSLTPVSIDATDKNKKENGVSRIQHKILNESINTTYTFDYNLSAVAAEVENFICETCYMDLKISIIDPDGKPLDLSGISGNMSTDGSGYEVNNISALDCTTPTGLIDISFNVLFTEIGDYTVIKTVTPKELSYEEMKTIVAGDSTVMVSVQQIRDSYVADPADCEICQETCPDAEDAINEAISEVATKDCENILIQIEQYYKDSYYENNPAAQDSYDVPQDSIETHPDYCAYQLCTQNTLSDVYEKQVARINNWDEAVAGGHQQLLVRDPFFTNSALSGYNYTGAMSTELDNIDLGTVPYDNNGDGVQDGTNTFTGSLDAVTDPANTAYYIDEDGNPDVNGKHILYLDLMGRQPSMTASDYQAELTRQRWIIYWNFYLEAKRKIKLTIPEYANCPKAREEIDVISGLPITEQDIKQWSIDKQITDSVSTAELEMSLVSITYACDTTFNTTDSTAIAGHLQAYFNENPDNFFRLIFKADIGINNHLNSIQTILDNYSCSLNAVALDNPLICIKDTTIYIADTTIYKTDSADISLNTSQQIKIFNNQNNSWYANDNRFNKNSYDVLELRNYYYEDTASVNSSVKSFQKLLNDIEDRNNSNSAFEGLLAMANTTSIPSWRVNKGKIFTDVGVQLETVRGLVNSTGSAIEYEIYPTQEEYDALIALYNSTNGPAWINKTGWETADPNVVEDVNGWHGVSVDVNGHVTGIRLENNGLSGSIPPQISALIYLNQLVLSNNTISNFPDEITNLINLTLLEIDNNVITNALPSNLANLINLELLDLSANPNLTGSIPSAIGNLQNLYWFDISQTAIGGELPLSITQLSKLRYLILGSTEITGNIPTDIGLMTSLETIILNNKMIGSIPSSITLLSNLKSISCTYGHFSGSLPTDIGNLTNLRVINFYSNDLSGVIPESFYNLNPAEVQLGYNLLEGSISSAISNMSNLQVLDLSNNLLSGSLPPELGNLYNLNTLWLGGNKNISGSIPTELGNLINLNRLDLNGNSLSGNIPSSLGQLLNLGTLYLADNLLTGSIPKELGNLTNLTGWLLLGNNFLTGNVPVELANLKGVRHITLDNNLLEGFIPLEFSLNSVDLKISKNKFTFSDFLHVKNNILSYSYQDAVDVEKNIMLIPGKSINLSAQIDRSTSPASRYRWWKIVNGVKTQLTNYSETGHTYTITNPTEADLGTQYFYEITNPDAPDLTLTSRLQTLVPFEGRIETICLAYDTTSNPTIDRFRFKIDWNSVVQRCLAKAAKEDSVLTEYAIEKLYESKVTEFYSSYQTNCLSGINDSLRYSYAPKEYHYTLYYYDQAGNLVQTVPPTGVKPLDTTQVSSVMAGNNIEPPHELITKYKYNSFNQLVWQQTPDAGASQFWYDDRIQLRLSQNAQQILDSTYSYTKYDEQGRIIEVGELYTSQALVELQDSVRSASFPRAADYRLSDVTRTFYDLPKEGILDFEQENLRSRVSYVEVIDKSATDTTATYYSYDIHGNVKSLLQHVPGIENKRTDYVYDLISGNVNFVMYQFGMADQLIHRYTYDADNRLNGVQTSTDGFLWDKEAAYTYYLHGPLARVELGEYRVQGVDYYYTLQGWLKGVNQPFANDPDVVNIADIGAGKDVFAFNLGYYNGDYNPVNPLLTPPDQRDNLWTRYNEFHGNAGLYNGNIVFMVTDLAQLGHNAADRTKGMQAMIYKYDQLNRIISARGLTEYAAATGFASRTGSPFDTDYTYDPNGNLLTLKRKDASSVVKDDFNYTYYNGTNRLRQYRPFDNQDKTYTSAVVSNDKLYRNITAKDNSYVPAGKDVELMAAGRVDMQSRFTTVDGNSYRAHVVGDTIAMYQYDAIGNLVRDLQDGVRISWTPYGKIRQVRSLSDSLIVSYRYDGSGNRIEKKVERMDSTWSSSVTRYVRDASGNVMAVYQDSLLIEQALYGSSRVGMYTGGKINYNRNLGTKRYELGNHLGNVLTVITDNIGMDQDSVWAKVVSTSDYYPFGLEMESRVWRDSTADYRYGFNGKEKDDKGEFGSSTHYDYGFRIYNPSIGKFLSVDPLTREFAWNSPYSFAENDVVRSIDLEGAERLIANTVESQEFLNNYIKIMSDGDILFEVGLEPFISCHDNMYYIYVVKSDGGWVPGADGDTHGNNNLIGYARGMQRLLKFKKELEKKGGSLDEYQEDDLMKFSKMFKELGLTPAEILKRSEEGFKQEVVVSDDVYTLAHELILHESDALDGVDNTTGGEEHIEGHGPEYYKTHSTTSSPPNDEVDPSSKMGKIYKRMGEIIKKLNIKVD